MAVFRQPVRDVFGVHGAGTTRRGVVADVGAGQPQGFTGGFGPPRRRRDRGCQFETARTSSIVVTPASTFSMPSWRSVRMPSPQRRGAAVPRRARRSGSGGAGCARPPSARGSPARPRKPRVVAVRAAHRLGRACSRPSPPKRRVQSASTASSSGVPVGRRPRRAGSRAAARRSPRRLARAAARQSLHSRRTRRCASTASSESAKLNGSMPMSSSRVTVSGALLVCSVRQHQVAGERGLDRRSARSRCRGSRRP